MVAEHAPSAGLKTDREGRGWLTLAQAACQLGVSVSTVRRLLRKGQLPSRSLPRKGGITYLVQLPLPAHDRGVHSHLCSLGDPAANAAVIEREAEIERLELQIERLSRALSGKLRAKQRLVPGRSGTLETLGGDPYARYRWLVRRHRWWPF